MSDGPHFEDLTVGQSFEGAPAYTLSDGRAAVHQAIVGDRLRLPLDQSLAAAVAGRSPLAHPAFVWNVAIGQSTLVTQHVKANLFYRGLVLRRLPAIGDTLSTVTTVEGLRQNTRRVGRAPTGLAALRIRTVDQQGRAILDFLRCAMLPLRSDVNTGHNDDLDRLGARDLDREALAESVRDWDLDAWRARVAAGARLVEGVRIEVGGGDVVSGAPELARLSLNIARVHHDEAAAGGRRLVYGGHTIALALAQVCRAIPDLVTVAGWHGCDHIGPVHEGDTLYSTVAVERLEPTPGSGTLAHLRSEVFEGTARRPVLNWRFVALLA